MLEDSRSGRGGIVPEREMVLVLHHNVDTFLLVRVALHQRDGCTMGRGGIIVYHCTREGWLWCYTIMWTGWLVGCSPPVIHLLLIHCFRRPGGGKRGVQRADIVGGGGEGTNLNTIYESPAPCTQEFYLSAMLKVAPPSEIRPLRNGDAQISSNIIITATDISPQGL